MKIRFLEATPAGRGQLRPRVPKRTSGSSSMQICPEAAVPPLAPRAIQAIADGLRRFPSRVDRLRPEARRSAGRRAEVAIRVPRVSRAADWVRRFFCLAFASWLFAELQPYARAVPTILSFDPAQGPPGTQIAISGRDFGDIVQVRFDTTLADFTIVTPERIIAIVPPGALTSRLSVVGLSGSDTTPGFFLVAPHIFELLPSRGATNSVVQIFGENFEAVNRVEFGDKPAQFAIVGPTQVSAIVPVGATNAPVFIGSPAGGAITIDDFIITGPGPILDGFTPAIAAPGTTVLIEGVNFTRVSAVTINGVVAAFSVPAESQIRAIVPASASSGPIRVTTARGAATSTRPLTVTRAPVITGFTPAVTTTGTEVRITGINFQNITSVTFNGVPATGFGTPAEGQLSAIVPASATTGPIRVSNSFGTGASATPLVITRTPVITEVAPGIAQVGQTLTVTGGNFTGATLVRFSGANAVPAVTADTQLQVVVPPGARSGLFSVVNPFGAGTNTAPLIIAGPQPYVLAVNPPAGPRGEEILISGANFNNVTAVRFNAVNATFNVTAPTQLRAIVPPTATTGRLTVTSAAGTSTNDVTFFVPPRLTSITPLTGVAGTPLTVLGTNFVGAFDVAIDGLSVPFTVQASNRLIATLTGETSGGTISIATPGGAIISTNEVKLLPRIDAFTPASGPAGTPVTIRGSGFFGVSMVSFGDVPAVFEVKSPEFIAATVPASKVPGIIRVVTSNGTADSATPFVPSGTSDLELSALVSAVLLEQPGPVTVTLTVSNRGPAPVTGVVLSNALPARATVVSATPTNGTCMVTDGAVVCQLGVLAIGAVERLTLVTQLSSEGIYPHRATVRAVEADPIPANDTAAVATVFIRPASRALEITHAAGGSQLLISWPVSPVELSLETSRTLGSASVWTRVATPPVIAQNRNHVTEPAGATPQFFRLRR